MDAIKLDSTKSLEIMKEIVSRINMINTDINILKKSLDKNNISNMWISDNADIFSEKALQTMEQFSGYSQEMYKDVLVLIESIENYTNLDKEVFKNLE